MVRRRPNQLRTTGFSINDTTTVQADLAIGENTSVEIRNSPGFYRIDYALLRGSYNSNDPTWVLLKEGDTTIYRSTIPASDDGDIPVFRTYYALLEGTETLSVEIAGSPGTGGTAEVIVTTTKL